MEELDRRTNAYRPDLADARLEGQVAADRFVSGKIMRIAMAVAPLLRKPSAGSAQDTEALFGEAVRVFESRDGWAWVQMTRDDYVGYIPTAALVPDVGQGPTHRVVTPTTLAFAREDIKSPVRHTLPLNALVDVLPEPAASGSPLPDSEKLVQLRDGSYIVRKHIAPVQDFQADFVAVAESFSGAPYLWGGCTRNGIDCSGLVQMALLAAGFECPRDSDQQERKVGESVAEKVKAAAGNLEQLARGDLLFWPGHVAIMTSADRLIHANALSMAVTMEPATEVIARIEKAGKPVSSVKRIARTSASIGS